MPKILLIIVLCGVLGYCAAPECFDGRGAIACLANKP